MSFKICRSKNGYIVANSETYDGNIGRGECWTFSSVDAVCTFLKNALTIKPKPEKPTPQKHARTPHAGD